MNSSKKTLGVALAATLGAVAVADGAFAMQTLDKGYMVAEAGKAPTGKCGAGKCGAGMCGGNAKAKAGEAVCGAGKCTVEKMDANKDGKVDKAEYAKHHEAMFGVVDANKDGNVDKAELEAWQKGAKPAAKAKEGKCGEGKCGGKK